MRYAIIPTEVASRLQVGRLMVDPGQVYGRVLRITDLKNGWSRVSFNPHDKEPSNAVSS